MAYEEQQAAILQEFGAHLRALRQKTGLSQEKFALHCGLDRTYIADIERGTRNVSLLNLHLLAQALGVDLSELVSFPGPGKKGTPRKNSRPN